MLSHPKKKPVSPSMVRKPKKPAPLSKKSKTKLRTFPDKPPDPLLKGLSNVLIEILVDDARGVSSHVNPPVLLEPTKGEVLWVSSDLAYGWFGSGTCKVVSQ